METFYRTHKYLIEHMNAVVPRKLMEEINWDDRLIGIKGSRGVGKTTFLLEYAKKYFGTRKECLYINLNQFVFSEKSLCDFAGDFYKDGGKTLLIDQVFKYENWSSELRKIYDSYPGLHIVFTGSSVMRLKEDNSDLSDIVKVYNIRGFSFREFIEYAAKIRLPSFSLEDIVNNHEKIVDDLIKKVNPFDYFQDYLHHGYYPFYMEKINYSENLLKTMNMMIEVDILIIKKIDLKYLSKIRKLLYLIGVNSPCAPNVSSFSSDIAISRATVMNYIKYLKDARLLNMLYKEGESYPKKPKKVYLNNTNLIYVLQNEVDDKALCETFFYNVLHKDNKINWGGKKSDFIVNDRYRFNILSKYGNKKLSKKMFYVKNNILKGEENIIPLWVFGFLY